MMEEPSTFDRLVEELSREERRQLLRKIENGVSVSDEPLRTESAEQSGADIEATYQSLNLILKILYTLKGLFTGKNPLEAFEGSLLVKLKKSIDNDAPKLADFRRSLFLGGMNT